MAMWAEKSWYPRLIRQSCSGASLLHHYSQVFNTVEGNTTFYALPQLSTVKQWFDDTPDDFRFSLKLPQSVSHQKQLHNVSAELKQFFELFAPLQHKLGLIKLQLPASFSPAESDKLFAFLKQLPSGYEYGVEVRHRDFFAKGEPEKRFNQTLIQLGMNRIIMDSRPVFSSPATTPVMQHAQRQKPNVPVHAIATGTFPIIRFIGDVDLAHSLRQFTPWRKKIAQWIDEGKSPYLYIHTADNLHAPELAQQIAQSLGESASWLHLPKVQHQQLDMF
ncbi:DUF72 domain-containing protein [Motilimonas pumila]|uniref:DUF72 domain-containing protein n=2 Tax=Motilimonas pumila TaxID=2303987 RepID=A0A418YFY0_9GAMM|nr:DUF72 domain-containing protein [Motilimonas pumila]